MPDPINYAWRGAARFAHNEEEMKKASVTREEYLEYGSNICRNRFSDSY